MAIVVTITADSPAQLAPMWAGLGGHAATVNLDTDHMWIDVDMRHSDEEGTEPFEPADPEPHVEVESQQDDHDGHTVDVGPVEEATEPEADVVPIERGARERHPAGGTLVAQVLDLFRSEPTSTFTPSDVIDHLDATGSTYGGVSGTIATLVRSGQLERVGRGKYQAAAQ